MFESNDLADDEVLIVPKRMINYPLGFVVDAGASTAKVVYRSKKDYKDREAVKPSFDPSKLGKLRLRNFDMNQVENIAQFLKENCDVVDQVGPTEARGLSGDGEEQKDWWWITGVTTQHFKKELESNLGIKTKLFSESLAIANYLKYFDQMELGCYETDLEAVTWAKVTSTTVYSILQRSSKMTGKLKKHEDDQFEETETSDPKVSSSDGPSFKLLTNDVESWVNEYLPSSGKLEYPFIFVNLGSTVPITLAKENCELEMVDFVFGAGKALSGLAEELTGESDFDKFIAMAERGDLENVDLTNSDVMNEEHDDDDWYRIMPRHLSVFELGKLSTCNIRGKGKYSKDDLAVGLLSFMLKLVSKAVFASARYYKVKNILFAGSLPKYKLVRHHLMKPLLMEILMNNLRRMDLIRVHFAKHPSFACALGVWWENVEKQEMKTTMVVEGSGK